MMKIHDMTNVKDYSVEYDRIMNKEEQPPTTK